MQEAVAGKIADLLMEQYKALAAKGGFAVELRAAALTGPEALYPAMPMKKKILRRWHGRRRCLRPRRPFAISSPRKTVRPGNRRTGFAAASRCTPGKSATGPKAARRAFPPRRRNTVKTA